MGGWAGGQTDGNEALISGIQFPFQDTQKCTFGHWLCLHVTRMVCTLQEPLNNM
jgi:hypothetical protein